MQKIDLPIDLYLDRISTGICKNSNLILTAPPGSGKTTRVPAALKDQFKKIIVLVPKRIAALSAASRVAEENNWTLGKEVGYQVRFDNKTQDDTSIIFMTEGVFIKKLQDKMFWSKLDLIIFDEFHERSSHLDLSLGICIEKQILEQKIKILIMSATLETTALQKYLSESILIEIESKPFPLEVIKAKKSQRLNIDFHFIELLTETLQQAINKSKKDILIFLPGLAEIRFVERHIQEKYKNFEINVLHGSIKLEEQKKILAVGSKRRLILSTNIAESSITLPSVDCVVDSGLVKKSITENKIGFKKLELSRISQFSAKQRAGRAARLGAGTCYQLWHEFDEKSMSLSIQPEIVNSDLLEESLILLSLGIDNPDQFSWLDRPKRKFKEAIDQLQKWDLVANKKGKLVQSTPLDIERSLIFIELSQCGFQKEASALFAFLESTNFNKQTESIDITNLRLNDLGRKIETQLNRIKITDDNQNNKTMKENLISLFFKHLPHKIAMKKDKNFALSSQGRGLELSSYLVTPDSDYYLLFSGRDTIGATTKCDFAVAFSTQDFQKFSLNNTRQTIHVDFDFDKRKLYKIEKKMAGYFTISESTRIYINEKQDPELFKDYFKHSFSELLQHHDHYLNYITKINFLKRKLPQNFDYLLTFSGDIYDVISESIHSIDEFFELNLFDILVYLTPEEINKNLTQLPTLFTLPNGKQIKIDYESEQAPKISARIQELFGQNSNPTLLNGQIRVTVELLAPNYRPTQITSQLENFWKTSYHEIKKELKSRYPKHAWPDDPTTHKPIIKKI